VEPIRQLTRRHISETRGLVVHLIGEHARQQSLKELLRQRCKLQQACVPPLQLALRQGVEINAPNTLLGTRSLQPTQQNLGGAGIGNGALPQTAFDFCVRRRLTLATRCAALAAQPCGFARLLLRPPVRSSSDPVSFWVSYEVSFVELRHELRTSAPGRHLLIVHTVQRLTRLGSPKVTSLRLRTVARLSSELTATRVHRAVAPSR
jgi:hypothetical protein